MKELSLHILDVVENGITAGADCIHIIVDESRKKDLLTIILRDNGKGIPPGEINNITDPFVTSRSTRKVGLGLSLFEAAAKRCDGTFIIHSKVKKGTDVTATFRYSHIDRAPVGDMAGTITTLILGNPQVNFVYHHKVDGKQYILDTREIKKELKIKSIVDPMIIYGLASDIRDALKVL